ncbi:hypothetical protein CAG70_19310 [Photobacterium halotolerans]|uniref:Uncharacterized protein n=2 Tax=Photobacterium halotolerans TaxID=265726 RepID=A0A7X4Y2Y5_9GAMM|nr:hypothetical protein [Photobacterium halotolerans]NAW64874.1 hypothetical protein [Photobacterium halotolerans]NAX49141.1 hypothetical protein [Photobacterium halotolerans]
MKHVSLSTCGGLAISVLTTAVAVLIASPLLTNNLSVNPNGMVAVIIKEHREILSLWPWAAAAAVLVQGVSLWLLTRSPLTGKCLSLLTTFVLFPFGLYFHICYLADCKRWELRMLQEVKPELKPEYPQFGFCDEDPLAFGLCGIGILMMIVGIPFGGLAVVAGVVIFVRNLAGKKKTALMVTPQALFITPNPWLGCYRVPYTQVSAVAVVKNQLRIQIDIDAGKTITVPVNINVLDRDLRRQARGILLDKLAHAGLLHEPVAV